jgi:plasmid maintenance system antidote protein VapI
MSWPMSRPPIHPGEILADALKEIGVAPMELARQIEIHCRRPVDAVSWWAVQEAAGWWTRW